MIKKILLYFILSIILLFLLTGCYDSTGLEKLSYVVAIGIDKNENNSIKLSIQLAKTDSSDSSSTSQSSDYKIYSVDCDSIDTGIAILNNYLNKKINLSHCSAIVVSEECAKENISSYITTLGNNTELQTTCNIIISSGDAYDVLDKISKSGEHFSSRLYEHILSSSKYTGYTIDTTINNFLACINDDKTSGTAIYAIISDDSIQNSGIAVFKNNVMVGTISPLHTIAYSMVKNELKSCVISIDSPFKEGDLINIELKKIKKPRINIKIINNTPLIDINLDFQGNIISSGESFDYTSKNNISIIQNSINLYIEKIVKEYLYETSKKYNSDISNFSNYATINYLTEDDFSKIHWNEIFKDSYFNVKSNVQITSTHLFNKR